MKNYTYEGEFMLSRGMRGIATQKRNISQYLLENQNLSSICASEGELLAQEANHWDNLGILLNELFKTAYYGPLKTWILSKPIIEEMKEELDEIIFIHEAIIEGVDI